MAGNGLCSLTSLKGGTSITVEERRIAALEALVVFLIRENVKRSPSNHPLLPVEYGGRPSYPSVLPGNSGGHTADTALIESRIQKLVDFALGRSDLDLA